MMQGCEVFYCSLKTLPLCYDCDLNMCCNSGIPGNDTSCDVAIALGYALHRYVLSVKESSIAQLLHTMKTLKCQSMRDVRLQGSDRVLEITFTLWSRPQVPILDSRMWIMSMCHCETM